ncbi:MAG TPA: YcxB family protein [Gemmatimonadales bacterium]|nr:YcxB family protein [Gemmatimonadales bacterium]
MRTITTVRSRQLSRLVGDLLITVAIPVAGVFVTVVLLHHTRYDSLAHAMTWAALPALLAGALSVGVRSTYEEAKVQWDGEGLTYVTGDGDTESMPWSDFDHFRRTWDRSGRLKIIRKTPGATFVIDSRGFSDDDQATLLTELGRRSGHALPHS